MDSDMVTFMFNNKEWDKFNKKCMQKKSWKQCSSSSKTSKIVYFCVTCNKAIRRFNLVT